MPSDSGERLYSDKSEAAGEYPMQLEVLKDDARTDVGSYFVANYPPFSAWKREHVPAALEVLGRPAGGRSPTPLGLYIHIPFCRKRCKFCYFRVYTDKNAADVDLYMDALAREVALYADRPRLAGRQFEFVYFGGGTPSFLSSRQLERLIEGINRHWRWDAAREVTFECEPGTLQKHKLETIRRIGVTRLSLGIEHFDDALLEANGRAHKSAEIFRAYGWARAIGFPQINVDLIAGMVGDEDAKWEEAVRKALELQPDSLTIYQLELPYNTVFSQQVRHGGGLSVTDWPTKRRWVDYAFQVFEDAGYLVSSGYTLVKAQPGAAVPHTATGAQPGAAMPPAQLEEAVAQTGCDSQRGAAGSHGSFVYRDSLWHGADMVGTGVASFSHVGGVHFQNFDQWDDYIAACQRGELPLKRALPMTPRQRLIRELILQLKLGRLDAGYFRAKFATEIRDEFVEAFDALVVDGFAAFEGDAVRLTRAGLLRVDALLPRFFEPQYRNVRYT